MCVWYVNRFVSEKLISFLFNFYKNTSLIIIEVFY